ncbi:receptor-type tyrosine-protein phosphatase alpha-like isoform X3 [Leptotrombidium deliense]|uniref:Receptor-type tyrosine-protein phosphatase alpha-like isoform X3 n=1 Tax=Leptotrombidium deliense TaxID=299467 RepID=A0A443SSX5_9ACAR|nr:receptor-type tyrosine-protein phosphatase alpha-like isoform X3 [Leptotrombidium deliense]
MVVQCLNGCTACGVYCGASFLCERIKEEQRIDVFLASSTARTQRRQFLQELDQFNLLYDISKHYTARLQTSGALKVIVES